MIGETPEGTLRPKENLVEPYLSISINPDLDTFLGVCYPIEFEMGRFH